MGTILRVLGAGIGARKISSNIKLKKKIYQTLVPKIIII
jgi:hypothetical protein